MEVPRKNHIKEVEEDHKLEVVQKKTTVPPARPLETAKPVSSMNPRPKPSQLSATDNAPPQSQPSLFVPSTNISSNQDAPSTRPPAATTNIAQPQAQPHFQYTRSYSSPQQFGIPPRTHSAPPNLQEQERQTPLFYPEKTPSTQYKPPYPYPYYNPFPMQPTNIMPPNTIHPQHPFPIQAGPSQSMMNPPTRKAIPIIDPETGKEEIISKNSPPKTRPLPGNNAGGSQTSSKTLVRGTNSSLPGGILPEFSTLKDIHSTPTPITITDPDEMVSTQHPATIAESASVDSASRSQLQKKENQSDKENQGKQRQEYRAKSPVLNVDERDSQEIGMVEKESDVNKQVESNDELDEDEFMEDQDESETEEERDINGSVLDASETIQEPSRIKKKSLKEVLKKADGGNYKAYTFDAYSDAPKEVDENVQQRNQQQSTASINQSSLEEEDEDDWENKDEDELVNLRRTSSPMSGGLDSETKTLSMNIASSLAYPSGVWSPQNLDGNKIYDRAFLLQFQTLCNERPPNLPDMSEVLGLEERGDSKDAKSSDKWRSNPSSSNPPGSSSRGFRDGRGARQSSEIVRNGPPPGFSPLTSRSSRGAPQPNSMGRGRMLKKGRSVSNIPEVTLPVTPGRWEPSVRLKDGDSEHERILKTVKGLLNKLTEAKFDQLSDEIVNVGVVNVDLLRDVIKLVFDKALSEPKFCKMYAELCRKLSASSNFSLDDKAQTFKRLLLNRCQEEFESSFKGSKKDASLNSENVTPEERQAYEEQMIIEKKKMLGNITFIGELYKIAMLTEKIMHECITKLLGDIKNPSDEDIEALCRLMTSIGTKIDHPKAKNYLDQYFARMKELSRNKALSSRIRFMLQDVIELRNQKWVITRENNALNVSKNPTDSQKSLTPSVARSREKEKQSNVPSHLSNPKSNSSNSSRAASGEWEQVPSKSKQRNSQRSQDDVRLQPSFLGPMSGSLSQGAKGWKQDQVIQPNNDASSKSSPRIETIEAAKTPSITSEEFESKIDMLLKDYLSTFDVSEAIVCIKELNSVNYYPEIVNRAIAMTLEKSNEDRELISKLFAALHEEGLLSSEHFQRGVECVLEIMDDLIIDIPNLLEFVAQFLANAILDEYFSMALLESLLKPLISVDNDTQAANLAAEVFLAIADQTSLTKLRELYRKSKLELVKLLPPGKRNPKDLISFLAEKELSDLMPAITYGSHLEKLLRERNGTATVLKWIQDNVPQDAQEDVTFCRHFVKCVLEQVTRASLASATITKEVESQEQQAFKEVAPALKYLLATDYLQRNCLFETQLFCYNAKFPKGLMERLFEYLYSFEIVMAEVFIMWSEDEGITDGKKESLIQINKWLNKLQEQIEEED